MKEAKRIVVTGAAGQISYSLLFRIAAGDLLGHDQPVTLVCLDIEPSMSALKGVKMELNDCAFPLLQELIITTNPNDAFENADIAFLVGARPRGPGMERADLLQANAEIFAVQGKALNDFAKKSVKVLVVGNPANTNALITQKNAPDINPRQIHAMMRLDHNRAMSQLAEKTQQPVTQVKHMVVWGNHSATQYPDWHQATVNNQSVSDLVDDSWLKETFIPTVQKRGAAVIDARGASSAASAANAAIDHMRNWVLGTADDEWVSMGVPTDGSYNVPEGLVFGMPCQCVNGEYTVVEGLTLNEFSQQCIEANIKELTDEKKAIEHLFA